MVTTGERQLSLSKSATGATIWQLGYKAKRPVHPWVWNNWVRNTTTTRLIKEYDFYVFPDEVGNFYNKACLSWANCIVLDIHVASVWNRPDNYHAIEKVGSSVAMIDAPRDYLGYMYSGCHSGKLAWSFHILSCVRGLDSSVLEMGL